MDRSHEQHLIIRLIEYGLKHQSFTLKKLEQEMPLNQQELDFLYKVATSTEGTAGPNHLYRVVGSELWPDTGESLNVFTLVPAAYFSYVDHLEIVVARQAAKEARIISIIAGTISVAALVASIYYGNQSIKLQKESNELNRQQETIEVPIDL